ncbi:hypothetical protein [Cohnella lupini]|jgi:hypothetical protein|uniref:Uncharacterized protein n=1 Tax=Cohnella lupini TaxID=1294267 RepID=A0A3D9I6X2_9BACL|nr:hypothetical protein [Cohnella lupini]RED57534.1 hypothetical protein DFP95_1106 [Cohnella lupini]
MDKQRYYVSVSASMVGTEPSLTDQLTIFATEEERNHLLALLNREQKATEKTYIRAQIPYKSADHDKATNRYNEGMVDIYRYIYQVGTIETKRHIEYMDILQELRTPDYHHQGYGHSESNNPGL